MVWDRIPVGARFSARVQTGPGAHPASCTMVTGSFPGVKSGRGVTLTPHHLLMPWSWKGRAIPLLILWAVRPVQSLSACTRVTFTFYLYLPSIWYSFLRARVRLCLGCAEWGRQEGAEGQASNEVDLGRAATANENWLTFQVFASGFKIQKNIFVVSYHRGFSAHSYLPKKYELGYSIWSAVCITNVPWL